MCNLSIAYRVYFFFILLIFLISVPSFGAVFEGKLVQREVRISTFELPQSEGVNLEDSAELEKFGNQLFSKSFEELKKLLPKDVPKETYDESIFTIYIKGKKIRVDSQEKGEKMSYIIDMKNNILITIKWNEKVAMITSFEDLKETFSPMQSQVQELMEKYKAQMETQIKKPQFSMKPTGEKKKILGIDCELFTGTDSEGKFTHMWITRGESDLFETFLNLSEAMSKMNFAEENVDDENEFIRQVKGVDLITKRISPEVIVLEEILEIQREKLSGNLFNIPPGFRKLNMKEMMQKQMEKFHK